MTGTHSLSSGRNSFTHPLLWFVFGLYLIVLCFTMYHHELWGDELHSWNIAKGSSNFFDLLRNIQYEGHPPVWYTVLWSISKCTHNPVYMQLAQLSVALLTVFVLLFYAPFPESVKVLLPFGYFFLYEYAILSRNYAIGILAGFLICIIIRKQFRYKFYVYYLLLFLMSNVHLFALVLATSLQVYCVLYLIEQKKTKEVIIFHVLLGILVLLPAVYFILPPSNSQLNTGFWLSRWSVSQLAIDVQSGLRAMVPIPAWWQYHYWNTQFIFELQSKLRILRFITPVLSLLLIGLGYFILKDHKKSAVLFLVNVSLTLLLGVIFTMGSLRHVGFIFISFIVAYWFYCKERTVDHSKKIMLHILLLLQLAGGIFMCVKDILLPFSNAYRITELIRKVPVNGKIVTDYWALNVLSAYTDQSFYCIDLQKTASFLLWENKAMQALYAPEPYCAGMHAYFKQNAIRTAYLISIKSPQSLKGVDSMFLKRYEVQLLDQKTGAVEKGSNLYLYKISLP